MFDKLAAALAALVAAIGSAGHTQQPPHHGPVPPVASATVASSPSPGMDGMNSPAPTSVQGRRTVTVPLQAMPAGTAELTFDGQRLTARLDVFGVTPGSTHRLALYEGRDNGTPSVLFPDVTADASGRLALSVSGSGRIVRPLAGGVFLQLDQGPSRNSDSGQAPEIGVAHQPIRAMGRNDVVLAFTSTVGARGKATLTYDARARALTVDLRASGLQPGPHAAHIHTGTCAAQGAVAYMLPDLVADQDGNASARTVIQNVTSPPMSGSYVNVHEGDMNQILVNGQPGFLFQPVTCGNVTAH